MAQGMVWVQSVDEEFTADVVGPVGPKDVEGEGAKAGEVAGLGPDTALVFEEGNVADVVASLFDAPMLSDCGAGDGSGQVDLAGVEGGFLRFVPKAGFGVLVPSQAGDPGDGGDQAVPSGTEATGDVEDLDPAVFLAAMATSVGGLGAAQGR